MTVGKSSRTPLKHWILNSELGRLVGVFGNPIAASKVPAKASPFLVVDLCAGDGVATEDCESSPAIITKHLKWAASRGVDVGGLLIEKDANTFSHLQGNTECHEWLTLIHGDARDWVPPDMTEKQAGGGFPIMASVSDHCETRGINLQRFRNHSFKETL